MANKDYLPARDALLLMFLLNMSARLTATPTAYGITAAQASAFAALVADFETRLGTASDPLTRTKVSVQLKNTSRTAVKSAARALARQVNADPDTTDGQRVELGLTVPDSEPTPAGAPTNQPDVVIEGTSGLQALVRITPGGSTNGRARAPGSAGSQISYAIRPMTDPAPTSPAECQPGGLATRTTHVLPIPPGSAGKVLWVMAQWYSVKGELGPVSNAAAALIAA